MTRLIKLVQDLESRLLTGTISKKQYLKEIDKLIHSENTSEALEYLIRKKDIEI